MEVRLGELGQILAQPDLWENPSKAQETGQERTRLTAKLAVWRKLEAEVEELVFLYDLALAEEDESQVSDVKARTDSIRKDLDDYETKRTLSGQMDGNNAIVDIHAGAGGTEAQDWAEMLSRMYIRYAERSGFSVRIVDRLEGEEAGVKSVTMTVSGPYAYGLLSVEAGIHRLVRVSPFDSQSRRHTSFASVFVTPEIDDDIVVDINEKDLRIDTYRASGAGGQHVNKTSSAVRITHIPTGIVVQCQDEKSQHRNKDLAMKVLKARLYQLEEEKKAAEVKKMHENKKDIAWGSQIRSYTLQPYRLIKDHRTGFEMGNVESVLDGDLAGFVKAALSWRASLDA
jgi:peptide chain release factor 2